MLEGQAPEAPDFEELGLDPIYAPVDPEAPADDDKDETIIDFRFAELKLDESQLQIFRNPNAMFQLDVPCHLRPSLKTILKKSKKRKHQKLIKRFQSLPQLPDRWGSGTVDPIMLLPRAAKSKAFSKTSSTSGQFLGKVKKSLKAKAKAGKKASPDPPPGEDASEGHPLQDKLVRIVSQVPGQSLFGWTGQVIKVFQSTDHVQIKLFMDQEKEWNQQQCKIASCHVNAQHVLPLASFEQDPSPSRMDMRLQSSHQEVANRSKAMIQAFKDQELQPAKIGQQVELQLLSVFLSELKARLQIPEESIHAPNELFWLQAPAGGPIQIGTPAHRTRSSSCSRTSLPRSACQACRRSWCSGPPTTSPASR